MGFQGLVASALTYEATLMALLIENFIQQLERLLNPTVSLHSFLTWAWLQSGDGNPKLSSVSPHPTQCWERLLRFLLAVVSIKSFLDWQVVLV